MSVPAAAAAAGAETASVDTAGLDAAGLDAAGFDAPALRRRVDEFFGRLPALLEGSDDRVERARRYRELLYDGGLAGLSYPVRFGGQGLPRESERIFREAAAGREPSEAGVFGIGLGMCVPTILEHGTDAMRERFVEPTLRGREIWCQLYSEPGAGSDLASLQTRAVLDGDEWVVSGQKVWTSGAQNAQLAVLLVRTNPDVPKHRGITMLVLPMEQAGVEVRPLRQMTGVAEFNEVFLDEARVPAAWVIGDVNDGWRMATALLTHERTSLGSGGGRQPAPFDDLAALARQRHLDGDPVTRQELAEVYCGSRIVGWLPQRGLPASVGKLWRTKQGRSAASVLHRLSGPLGAAWPADDEEAAARVYRVLDAPALSLGGGSDEVQRNTLGERVLDLPREPSVDRDVAFRNLRVGTQRSSGSVAAAAPPPA